MSGENAMPEVLLGRQLDNSRAVGSQGQRQRQRSRYGKNCNGILVDLSVEQAMKPKMQSATEARTPAATEAALEVLTEMACKFQWRFRRYLQQNFRSGGVRCDENVNNRDLNTPDEDRVAAGRKRSGDLERNKSVNQSGDLGLAETKTAKYGDEVVRRE